MHEQDVIRIVRARGDPTDSWSEASTVMNVIMPEETISALDRSGISRSKAMKLICYALLMAVYERKCAWPLVESLRTARETGPRTRARSKSAWTRVTVRLPARIEMTIADLAQAGEMATSDLVRGIIITTIRNLPNKEWPGNE